MSKVLFAGSFNPFTVGHMSVVKYAEELLKKSDTLGEAEVNIGITQNPSKPAQNLDLIKWMTNPIYHGFGSSKIHVVNEPLLVDYMKNNDYGVLVRSFRNAVDIIAEMDMQAWNYSLGGVHTMFVPAQKGLDHISSSAIRSLNDLGVDMKKYLPSSIQAKRWKNGRPKRIIVIGSGMGCGKSSFIKDNFRAMGYKSYNCFDMDVEVKNRLSDSTAEWFKAFFEETPTERIAEKWGVAAKFGNQHYEVEEIIHRFISSNNANNIFEISAFTAYDLYKYYYDSIIIYVDNYRGDKVRDVDESMQYKMKQLLKIPTVVDYYIDYDKHDSDSVNRLTDIIKSINNLMKRDI